MSSFSDLTWERSKGELRGRGHAVALPDARAKVFANLWLYRRSGSFLPTEALGASSHHAAGIQLTVLRKILRQFDLAIESNEIDKRDGLRAYRLVDRMPARSEEVTQ